MNAASEEPGRRDVASGGSRGGLGDRFREMRQHHGVTLETAAQALRIPVRTLDAMERGAYGELPADVYLRGFVKAYAEYLGMDPDEALKEFAAERQALPADESRRHNVTILRPLKKR